jgi:ribose/xylose/arabinose/galactoside ABC-type transport system permease subunit
MSESLPGELAAAGSGTWKQALIKLGPLFGLVFVYLLFVFIGPPSFRETRNLEAIARQTTTVAVAALGMTLVIISAGIDLSVGSIVASSTVVVAWLLARTFGMQVQASEPAMKVFLYPLLFAVATVAVGALCGVVSGLLITRLRVVPFIVTLGMMLIVRGAGKGLAHEEKIMAPETWLNRVLETLGPQQRWMLVPGGVWLLIFLAILMGGVLRYTRFGRHVFAVGSNEQTARLCGVPVNRVKVIVYMLSGMFAGLAGVMQFARLCTGDPTVVIGLELDVIAAVVIGGASFSGGEGTILGTIVGALIMGVIRSGCAQMGLPNWVQEIVTGGIIVVAVALDNLRHRRMT